MWLSVHGDKAMFNLFHSYGEMQDRLYEFEYGFDLVKKKMEKLHESEL